VTAAKKKARSALRTSLRTSIKSFLPKRTLALKRTLATRSFLKTVYNPGDGSKKENKEHRLFSRKARGRDGVALKLFLSAFICFFRMPAVAIIIAIVAVNCIADYPRPARLPRDRCYRRNQSIQLDPEGHLIGGCKPDESSNIMPITKALA
jgi:hypothetical protein